MKSQKQRTRTKVSKVRIKPVKEAPKKNNTMAYVFSGCAIFMIIVFGIIAFGVILGHMKRESQAQEVRILVDNAEDNIADGKYKEAEKMLARGMKEYHDIPEVREMEISLERAKVLPLVLEELNRAEAMVKNDNVNEAKNVVNNVVRELSKDESKPIWKKDLIEVIRIRELKVISQHFTKNFFIAVKKQSVDAFLNFINPEYRNRFEKLILRNRIRKFMNMHVINKVDGFVQISEEIEIAENFEQARVPYYVVSEGKNVAEGHLGWYKKNNRWYLNIQL